MRPRPLCCCPTNGRETCVNLRNVVEWAVSMHDDSELKAGHLEILEVVKKAKGDGRGETAKVEEPINWTDFVLPQRNLPY